MGNSGRRGQRLVQDGATAREQQRRLIEEVVRHAEASRLRSRISHLGPNWTGWRCRSTQTISCPRCSSSSETSSPMTKSADLERFPESRRIATALVAVAQLATA